MQSLWLLLILLRDLGDGRDVGDSGGHYWVILRLCLGDVDVCWKVSCILYLWRVDLLDNVWLNDLFGLFFDRDWAFRLSFRSLTGRLFWFDGDTRNLLRILWLFSNFWFHLTGSFFRFFRFRHLTSPWKWGYLNFWNQFRLRLRRFGHLDTFTLDMRFWFWNHSWLPNRLRLPNRFWLSYWLRFWNYLSCCLHFFLLNRLNINNLLSLKLRDFLSRMNDFLLEPQLVIRRLISRRVTR